MRRIVVVRVGALLVGSAVIVLSVLWARGPYRNFEAYRHAYPCSGGVPTPAADVNGCVASELGVVTGRSISEGADDSGSSTYYKVDYRRASGAQDSQEGTGKSFYDAATVGTQLRFQTWDGHVVGIFVGDTATGVNVAPPSENALCVAVALAWTGLGLIVWFLAGDGTLRHLVGKGRRPAGWIAAGGLIAVEVHVVLSGWGIEDEMFMGAFLLILLSWALYLSFTAEGGGGGNAADSLLRRALDQGYERRLRRRERAKA